MLSSKIQQKVSKEAGKKPSQKEIQAYYEQHKSQYGQPEKRNILIILTKTQAQAEKAKKEIESGKSFASVAKAVSIDPVSKAAGGSLPGVVKGQEEKALDEAVFSAKIECAGRSRSRRRSATTSTKSRRRSRQPADALPGAVHDPAADHAPRAAEGAQRIRQGLPQEVDGAHRMPCGILGAGLQGLQSPEDATTVPAPAQRHRRRHPATSTRQAPPRRRNRLPVARRS